MSGGRFRLRRTRAGNPTLNGIGDALGEAFSLRDVDQADRDGEAQLQSLIEKLNRIEGNRRDG